MKLRIPRRPQLFVFLLLMGAALKDDQEATMTHEFWSELAVHPLVSFLKSFSLVFVAMAAALGLLAFIKTRRASINASTPALMLAALSAITAGWALYQDPENVGKLLQASALYLITIVGAGAYIHRWSVDTFKQDAYTAMVWFSLAYIGLNVFNLVLGFGFVPGNPRFFGTTGHPNFIGVQLAICNMVLFSRLLHGRQIRLTSRGVLAAALLAGLVAEIASGSRTSLVILFAGMSLRVLAWRRYKMMMPVVIMTALGLGGVGLFMANPELAAGVFDRGDAGTNTRAEAWASMMDLIAERPWLGLGYFEGFSENSYMRAMVGYGIPYGALLTLVVLWVCWRHYRASRKRVGDRTAIDHLSFSMMAALFVGGMFEAFLVDAWSLPKLMFLLMAILAVSRVRAPSREPARHRIVVPRPVVNPMLHHTLPMPTRHRAIALREVYR